jgi:hypothetical protein
VTQLIIVTVTSTSVADPTKSASTVFPIAPAVSTPGVTVLLDAVPITNSTAISFSMNVTGVWLEPGDVPLLKSPVPMELNRLQVESALLATSDIPAGTYTALKISFASPVLTVSDTSGHICGFGLLCEMNPTLTANSVTVAGAAFPVIFDGSKTILLTLDFDMANSISGTQTVTPTLTARQAAAAELKAKSILVKEASGLIIYTGGDDIIDGATLNLYTDEGIFSFIDDTNASYHDVTAFCGNFICVNGTIADVDFAFTEENQAAASLIELKPTTQPEIEGTIVAIKSTSQFDLAVLHNVPPEQAVGLGDIVHINLSATATVESVDWRPPATSRFSSAADLLVGQTISARVTPDALGAAGTFSADRVRLKSGAFTGHIASASGNFAFVVDQLPEIFGNPTLNVTVTGPLLDPSTSLSEGDLASFSGELVKNISGGVDFIAQLVRKH